MAPVECLKDIGWEPISAAKLLKKPSQFKLKTGLGTDFFHPRHVQHISHEGNTCLAKYLQLFEDSAFCPEHAATILFHLIPKAAGGLRTIGVMPSLLRMWEAARCEEFAVSMRLNERCYDWARIGRSPEAAIWRQLLFAESPTHLTQESMQRCMPRCCST